MRIFGLYHSPSGSNNLWMHSMNSNWIVPYPDHLSNRCIPIGNQSLWAFIANHIMAQWVGHPASMAFLMPGEVWDRAKRKGKLKLKMVYKTSWLGKTVRLIPTKFKGKETTYYDLYHEGNILKILILCILFTSSFKLCFIAATLPLEYEGSRESATSGGRK